MTVENTNLKEAVMDVLETVKDPEMDTISVVQLGMIEDVIVKDGKATIKVIPTFVGCPALDIIEDNIANAAKEVDGIDDAEVEFIKDPPWTTDRISELGRKQLKDFGIAPPPKKISDNGEWEIECPYCGSKQVQMENIFGPSACRSILYCRECRNPFEAMKPISTMN